VKWFSCSFLLVLILLSGCTNIQRLSHMHGDSALQQNIYTYSDGEKSIYYTFNTGNSASDTFVFFYGGSGCASWKSVMPDYIEGFETDATVFVLNKRFVPDKSLGVFDCGDDFHISNNLEQWVSDYLSFIESKVAESTLAPKNVILVGVSEGALVAVKVAAQSNLVSHLAVIGSGAWSMRESLNRLYEKNVIPIDVNSEWEEVAADPGSITKKKYGHPYRWWSEIMDHSPINDYLELEIPILVGMGENDTSVPFESAEYLASRFDDEGKNNLKVNIYPEADHQLNSESGSYREAFFRELAANVQNSAQN